MVAPEVRRSLTYALRQLFVEEPSSDAAPPESPLVREAVERLAEVIALVPESQRYQARKALLFLLEAHQRDSERRLALVGATLSKEVEREVWADSALKAALKRALYARPNSFTDLLPWREYDAVNTCFVLEDSTSVGAYFELAPVGCEARPDQWMRNLRDNFQNVLHAIPEVDDGYL